MRVHTHTCIILHVKRRAIMLSIRAHVCVKVFVVVFFSYALYVKCGASIGVYRLYYLLGKLTVCNNNNYTRPEM